MMNNITTLLEKEFGENRIKKDEEISGKVSSRIGGKVGIYLEVQKQDELLKALHLLTHTNFILIGTGSRVIISDEGYSGVVLKNNCRKFEILSMRGKIKNNKIDVDKAYLYAESGCLLNQAVRYSLDNGFAGIEDLLGSSGSIGGFLMSSLLTNDKNAAIDAIYQIRLIDRDGHLKFIDPAKTPLKDTSRIINDTDVILSATFLITSGDEKKLWEKATKKATEKELEFTLGRPLGFMFHDITLGAAMSTPTPGYITSAKELIEKSGASGIKIGEVMNSTRDGNLLLSTGNATTKDIIELVKEIRSRVFKKFGVKLEMQLKIIK